MKIPRPPHEWPVTPRRAVEIQCALASDVRVERPQGRLRFAAGVDAAFDEARPHETHCIAAAVVWDLEREVVVEERVATREVTFPYVPGLLSFREAPAVLSALRKIRDPVDVVLCDGQGLAHPRRFGLACHVGVLCGRPTIGCAKSLLVGRHGPLAAERGARAPLVHGGQIVGSALRTRTGVRPVYVSVGHAIDLETAERVVLRAAARYRLPEPARLADKLARRTRREAAAQ